MHVKYSTRLTWAVVAGSVFWLGILLALDDERLPDPRLGHLRRRLNRGIIRQKRPSGVSRLRSLPQLQILCGHRLGEDDDPVPYAC